MSCYELDWYDFASFLLLSFFSFLAHVFFVPGLFLLYSFRAGGSVAVVDEVIYISILGKRGGGDLSCVHCCEAD